MKRIRIFTLLVLLCLVLTACKPDSVYHINYQVDEFNTPIAVSVSCNARYKRTEKVDLIIGYGKYGSLAHHVLSPVMFSIQADGLAINDEYNGHYETVLNFAGDEYIWKERFVKGEIKINEQNPPRTEIFSLSFPEDLPVGYTGNIRISLSISLEFAGDDGEILPKERQSTVTLSYTVRENDILFS